MEQVRDINKEQKQKEQIEKMIDSIFQKSTLESIEKSTLKSIFLQLWRDSQELDELKKDNKLYNDLIEQKQITKYWFDKLQDLKQDHERLLYKTGIKKIVKDPYLSARGERLD